MSRKFVRYQVTVEESRAPMLESTLTVFGFPFTRGDSYRVMDLEEIIQSEK